jgi:peroxiredoxin/outer membrane lipoprotein-sorting protein
MRIPSAFFVLGVSIALAQTTPTIDIPKIVSSIAARAATGQYSMEGHLLLEGQRGASPGRILAQSRFKLAAAPNGKSRLELAPADEDEYLLVSNGQKTWAFVPKLKQYTEEEVSLVDRKSSGEEDEGEPAQPEDADSTTERDLSETFLKMMVDHLSRFHRQVQGADVNGTAQVRFERQKETWPVVRVVSVDDPRNGLTLTEIAVNPATLAIGRLLWANRTKTAEGDKVVLRMTAEFSSFRLGESVPDEVFTFTPPKNARRVESVPIPGQTGSFLLNQPAPDFELKTLEGERVRLSELRGKPVVLTFWASWCGPCRRELPELAEVYDRLKQKGLLVYGLNDEGKHEARAFSQKAALSFPTLDDSSLKAHRLYRVRAIPSLFIIGPDGKVVRFLRGGHNKADLLSALKVVGF